MTGSGFRGYGKLLVGLTIAAGLAACSDRVTDVDDGNGDIVEIRMTADLRFDPPDVQISPGTTVRWVNDVAMFHTITANNPGQAGAWQEGQVSTAGQTFTHTFTQAGTFDYVCQPHVNDGMTGRVRVQ